MMAIRKNDLMYTLFGASEGKCKDCNHFKHRTGGYSKCLVYGDTASEASDWAGKWQACGLFNKDTKHENVIRMVRKSQKANIVPQIDGQLSIFDI